MKFGLFIKEIISDVCRIRLGFSGYIQRICLALKPQMWNWLLQMSFNFKIFPGRIKESIRNILSKYKMLWNNSHESVGNNSGFRLLWFWNSAPGLWTLNLSVSNRQPKEASILWVSASYKLDVPNWNIKFICSWFKSIHSFIQAFFKK